jgi:hypothetical protein
MKLLWIIHIAFFGGMISTTFIEGRRGKKHGRGNNKN